MHKMTLRKKAFSTFTILGVNRAIISSYIKTITRFQYLNQIDMLRQQWNSKIIVYFILSQRVHSDSVWRHSMAGDVGPHNIIVFWDVPLYSCVCLHIYTELFTLLALRYWCDASSILLQFNCNDFSAVGTF